MAESMERANDVELPTIKKTKNEKRKKRSRKDLDLELDLDPSAFAASASKRGVCYLSRLPPHMDPSNLRQILSNFGEIHRIYLAPEDPAVQVKRKQRGGFQKKEFSEGWVEFAKKRDAKYVVNVLNGEQIGGRRRSSFFYDTWNIKYLSKFKWDDLTSEIAEKSRTREQKLALEISAAKRERDFYLSKVDKSRALNSIKERIKKKQKTDEPESNDNGGDIQERKIIRRFPQNKLVKGNVARTKPVLSEIFLSGVFCGHS